MASVLPGGRVETVTLPAGRRKLPFKFSERGSKGRASLVMMHGGRFFHRGRRRRSRYGLRKGRGTRRQCRRRRPSRQSIRNRVRGLSRLVRIGIAEPYVEHLRRGLG